MDPTAATARPRPVFRLLQAAAGWAQVTQVVPGALSNDAHWGCRGVRPEPGDGPCPDAPPARYGQDSRGMLNWTTTGDEDVPLTTVLAAARRVRNGLCAYQTCAIRGVEALIRELEIWVSAD